MNEELIDYIRKEKKKGFSGETIIEALVERGFSRTDAENAFKKIIVKRTLYAGMVILALLLLFTVLLVRYNQKSYVPPDLDKSAQIPGTEADNAGKLAADEAGRNKMPLTPEEQIAYPTLSEMNMADKAVDLNELSLCEQSGTLKQYCIAVVTKNWKECSSAGKYLVEPCIARVAVIVKDETLCEKTGSMIEMCYAQVGIAAKDVLLCEKAGKMKVWCEKMAARQ